jgi:hypothetical protein
MVIRRLADRRFGMIVFASPNLGAGGSATLFLCYWATALVLVGVSLRLSGLRLVSVNPRRRRSGIFLFVATILLSVGFYLAPPHLCRLVTGHYPLDSLRTGPIDRGMTMAQIAAALGEPGSRNRQDDGTEWWDYGNDAYGLYCTIVSFGADGRVISIRSY